MRQLSTTSRHPTAKRRAGIAAAVVGTLACFGFAPAAVGAVHSGRPVAATTTTSAPARLASVAPKVTAPAPQVPVAPKVVAAVPAAPAKVAVPVAAVSPASRIFATGNAQLDALLVTLPAVLFTGKASVHYGYNPVDCCHAGGYNPGPNAVWVSAIALRSRARLVYVTVHELGHSVHLHSARGAALTAAVAGAPSVRPGSPWDVSEKVADCVAWALYPAETAASGLTYWSCPDPWRSQVRAALG